MQLYIYKIFDLSAFSLVADPNSIHLQTLHICELINYSLKIASKCT